MSLHYSIIVPHLNRKRMLQEALASVRAQKWTNVEIIVVDGGSTDGSVEELRASPDVKLLTGPDGGVFEAFNKGIAAATGDIVAILNSDDLYPAGTFAAVAAAFALNPAANAVCGTAVLMENDRTIEIYDNDADKALTPRTIMIGSCVPNARFFRRAAVARVGAFSLDYQYVADRDWLARWYEAGLATTPIPQLVYSYRRHPESLTFDANRSREEHIRRDLLLLAIRWSRQEGADPALRHAAQALEGRCRAWFALRALRKGQLMEFTRTLFAESNKWGFSPMLAVLKGALDRARRKSPANRN